MYLDHAFAPSCIHAYMQQHSDDHDANANAAKRRWKVAVSLLFLLRTSSCQKAPSSSLGLPLQQQASSSCWRGMRHNMQPPGRGSSFPNAAAGA